MLSKDITLNDFTAPPSAVNTQQSLHSKSILHRAVRLLSQKKEMMDYTLRRVEKCVEIGLLVSVSNTTALLLRVEMGIMYKPHIIQPITWLLLKRLITWPEGRW